MVKINGLFAVFAAVLALSGMAFAAHSASASVTPGVSLCGANSLTFSITNNGPDSIDVITVIAPEGYDIGSPVCPSGFSMPAETTGPLVCQGGSLHAGETATLTLNALPIAVSTQCVETRWVLETQDSHPDVDDAPVQNILHATFCPGGHITLVSPAEGIHTNDLSGGFTFIYDYCNDVAVTCGLVLDGKPQGIQGPFSVGVPSTLYLYSDILQDGVHQWAVNCNVPFPTQSRQSGFTLDTMAPQLREASIASDNADPALAKVGNRVKLTFSFSEPLASAPAVALAGRPAESITGSGSGPYVATTAMAPADPEGTVMLKVGPFSDLAGNNGEPFSTTTDGSSVTFDMTAPQFRPISSFYAGRMPNPAVDDESRITAVAIKFESDEYAYCVASKIDGLEAEVFALEGKAAPGITASQFDATGGKLFLSRVFLGAAPPAPAPAPSSEKACKPVKSCSDCVAFGMCDADADGAITSSDVMAVRKFALGLAKTCGMGGEDCYCDYNGDGIVTNADAMLISRCIPASTEVCSDGFVVLEAKCADAAGNSELYYEKIPCTELIEDNKGPDVEITNPLGILYAENTLDLVYTAKDPTSEPTGISKEGVGLDSASCSYSLGGSEISLTHCQSTPFSVSDGTHQVEVFAFDYLGNMGSSLRGFATDTIAPVVSITSPSEAATYSTAAVALAYTVSDANMDTCSYSLNGGAEVPLPSCEGATLAAASGANSLVLYAMDKAGHTSSATVSFSYIAPAPPPSGGGTGGNNNAGGPVYRPPSATPSTPSSEPATPPAPEPTAPQQEAQPAAVTAQTGQVAGQQTQQRQEILQPEEQPAPGAPAAAALFGDIGGIPVMALFGLAVIALLIAVLYAAMKRRQKN